jgi:hypothetical protein
MNSEWVRSGNESRLKSIRFAARYKCVRSDSMSQNNEKVELHRYREKLAFLSRLAHTTPFIAVTHISQEYSRGVNGGMHGGKFMYAINVLI